MLSWPPARPPAKGAARPILLPTAGCHASFLDLLVLISCGRSKSYCRT